MKYIDKFDGEALPEAVRSVFYKNDFHDVYIGEIVESYNEG